MFVSHLVNRAHLQDACNIMAQWLQDICRTRGGVAMKILQMRTRLSLKSATLNYYFHMSGDLCGTRAYLLVVQLGIAHKHQLWVTSNLEELSSIFASKAIQRLSVIDNSITEQL